MQSSEFLKYFNLKRPYFFALLLLSFVTINSFAQKTQILSLSIGDVAPPLKVKEWIKGTPVASFENGKIYVIEFWATWCRPCKAAMPHLSALANLYKDNVTFIGIDILEWNTTSIQKVKSFVDSMGTQMDYNVATEEADLMQAGWLNASGEQRHGIPRTFVVDADGKLAWIGHPANLAEVLPKIVNGIWNIKEALDKRNSDRYLRLLDDSLNNALMKYRENEFKKGDKGKPELALAAIDKIIKHEPRLKYAPLMAYNTFTSLLKTNLHKAYEYGKAVLETSSYEDPAYDVIYDEIEFYSARLKLPSEIYELGAEAYQMKIDKFFYPQLLNLPKNYSKMASFYWRANNKSKAIAAQQKAIESLKASNDLSNAEMATLESQLQKYRKM